MDFIHFSLSNREPKRITYRLSFKDNNVHLNLDKFSLPHKINDMIIQLPENYLPISYKKKYMENLYVFLKNKIMELTEIKENIEIIPCRDDMLKYYSVPRIALITKEPKTLINKLNNINYMLVKVLYLKNTHEFYKRISKVMPVGCPKLSGYSKHNWIPIETAYRNIKNKDMYILLLIEYHGNLVRFGLPGGKPEIHESLDETAVREFKEEVSNEINYKIITRTPSIKYQTTMIWQTI